MERREQWKSTFTQLFQARANQKGNIILFASPNSKVLDMRTFQEISKNLDKRHKVDFHKMWRKLEVVI